MTIHCAKCRRAVDAPSSDAPARPEAPFLCDACRALAAGAPAGRIAAASRPRAAAPGKPKPPMQLDFDDTPMPGGSDAEPVSMRDLEMILAPGVAPPPLPGAAFRQGAAVGPAGAPRGGDRGAGDLAAMAAPPPAKTEPSRVAPPAPRPAPPAAQPREAPLPAPPDSSAEDLSTMAALCPPTKAPPAPAPPAPAPKLTAVGASAGDTPKPIAVRAAAQPPPNRAAAPVVATPVPTVEEDEERPPDSGLSDLRSMAALLQRHEDREERVDNDVLNLSGGLFGGAGGAPLAPVAPPDLLGVRTTPPPSGKTLAPTSSPARPNSGGETPPAPVKKPAAPAPVTDDPKRGTRGGWLLAAAALALATWFAVGRSGPSVTVAPASTEQPTATEARALEARPSPPTPPTEATPAVAEPSIDDPAPGAAARPGAPEPKPGTAAPRDASGALVAPKDPAPKAAAPVAAAPSPDAPKTPKETAPTPPAPAPPPPPVEGGPAFDRGAASAALAAAAGDASGCRKEGDPSGTARVTVTFAPSGRVTSANVNGPPFAGTPTGGCIAMKFRKATVPPFEGDPQPVSKTVTIQ